MIELINNHELKNAKNIHEIFQKSYKIEAKILNVSKFPPLERSITNIQESKNIFYAFFIDRDITSIIEVFNMKKSTHIQSLVVHPDYFRQGIASQMLRFIINKSKKRISVETGSANHPAKKLYESFNFSKKKEWNAEYEIKKISYELTP